MNLTLLAKTRLLLLQHFFPFYVLCQRLNDFLSIATYYRTLHEFSKTKKGLAF